MQKYRSACASLGRAGDYAKNQDGASKKQFLPNFGLVDAAKTADHRRPDVQDATTFSFGFSDPSDAIDSAAADRLSQD